MPVDPEPVPGGNVVPTGRATRLDENGPPRPEVKVEPAGTAELFEVGDRFVSHFSTCPDADDWRRGR